MSSLEVALSQVTAEECVVTLAKIFDNILTEESYQKKTRKFKLSNETFSRRVVQHAGGLDVLIACRFTKKGQNLQLMKENENKMTIWNARRALQQRAEYLGLVLPKIPPMPSKSKSDCVDRFDSTSLYESSTVATIDELDLEISRELENSPTSTSQYQSYISPFGPPLSSTQDLYDHSPMWNALDFPVVTIPTASNVQTSPVLVFHSSVQSHAETLQPPTMMLSDDPSETVEGIAKAIDPSITKQSDIPLVAMACSVRENYPSITKRRDAPTEVFEGTTKSNDSIIVNEINQETSRESSFTDSQTKQTTASHFMSEEILEKETSFNGALEATMALSHQPDIPSCSFQRCSTGFNDGQMMQMRKDLNDSVRGDDLTSLHMLDAEVIIDCTAPFVRNLLIDDIPETLTLSEDGRATIMSELPSGVHSLSRTGEDDQDSCKIDSDDAWATDDRLLQEMEAELNAVEDLSSSEATRVINCPDPGAGNGDPQVLSPSKECFVHESSIGSPLLSNDEDCFLIRHSEVQPTFSIEDIVQNELKSLPSRIVSDTHVTQKRLGLDPLAGGDFLDDAATLRYMHTSQKSIAQNGSSRYTSSCELVPHDSDDELPLRFKMATSQSVDDLEKEMAKLLASCSENTSASAMPFGYIDCIHELDTDNDSVVSNRNRDGEIDDDDTSIPDHIQELRRRELASGTPEDQNYSSGHAHSDWLRLNDLMKQNSLQVEYEACWGSLCTLSVVCADLPTHEIGLAQQTNRRSKKSLKNRSKRAWLPLELVQGLWKLVLSSFQDQATDSARVAYVCSKLYDVLVESQYLQTFTRGENDTSPHNSWVRVRKEKMVLLGFALPISISKQSEWMRNLAVAIMSDDQFWYGRYALPTIALAGCDNEEKGQALLCDMDYVQSRLDVIGIFAGTRRHVEDCRSFIHIKRTKFRDNHYRCEDLSVDIGNEAGIGVALEACHQVATYLYKHGQIVSKLNAPAIQMIELADALRLVGTAVGEWGDMEMEMQLYQKSMNVLRKCGGQSSESAADTLLSMGHCSLARGDFDNAIALYEEALEMYRHLLGSNSSKVAEALHHTGVVYCERSDLDAAMETLKTSLKIKQKISKRHEYDDKTADTFCWIGKVYRERDMPEKAKKYFDTARDVKEEIFGSDSLNVAEILHNIAVLHDDAQDYERSLHYYRKCLKIRRAALGDRHDDVCDTISSIGNVYKSMGETTTALKVFRRANDLRAHCARTSSLTQRRTLTLIRSYEDVIDVLRIHLSCSQNPETEKDEISSLLLKMGHLYDTINFFSKSDRCFDKALELRLSSGDLAKAGQVLNVMGISFAKRRKYADAMTAFERALQLRKKCLGDNHMDVAETLHNMGNCAAKSNDLNEARAFYDEALRIKRKQLINNDVSVAQTLHNIGNVLAAQGSNEGAMKNYSEALAIRVTALGDESLEVAYSLHCIAKINRKQHDIDLARDNFNVSLRIKRLRLPKHHRSIAETLEQLGSIYIDIGDEEEGVLCLNAALKIYKSLHGEGDKIAQIYEQLGTRCERMKKIPKALGYFHRALRVRTRVLGEEHVSVAEIHYRIGKLQRQLKSHCRALASFQAATVIRKKIVGRNDLLISDILADAGNLQIELGQVDVADKCFSEALRIRLCLLDPRHEKIGESMILSGKVLIAKKRYAEAIAMLQDALGIFQDNTGEFGLLCANAYHELGKAYLLTGDHDKALENLEKSLRAHKVYRKDSNDLEVAKVNHSLGEVFCARGDYRKAEDYFRECVEAMVIELGDDHLDVANAVMSLGRTCNMLNSPDEATMYFEQARLTKQLHLGDSHLEVLEVDVEIGRCHFAKKEFIEALQAFQSYLRARRASVGDDKIVCDMLLEIGMSEYHLGRHDTSLSTLASALTLYRVLLGDDEIPVANTLFQLGVVYEAKQGYQESMKYHKEAFRLRRRLLGPDDLSVAQSLDKISNLYLCQPNVEKALQSMKEVLRIRTLKLGKDHIDVGGALFGMGVILSEANDLDNAMECYNRSLTIRRRELGEGSVEVAKTLHNMGTVFGKRHDFECALEHWRMALASYREAGSGDEDHLVAITIGNINMAEAYLDDSGQNYS